MFRQEFRCQGTSVRQAILLPTIYYKYRFTLTNISSFTPTLRFLVRPEDQIFFVSLVRPECESHRSSG